MTQTNSTPSPETEQRGLTPEGRVCCWGGAGGSTVIIDVDRRITFAYVMNKMAPTAVIAPALAERLKDIATR